VFIQTLLPCFTQIAKRTEELLYENLAASFLQIFRTLGRYLNDVEIKVPMSLYINNLNSFQFALVTNKWTPFKMTKQMSIFDPQIP